MARFREAPRGGRTAMSEFTSNPKKSCPTESLFGEVPGESQLGCPVCPDGVRLKRVRPDSVLPRNLQCFRSFFPLCPVCPVEITTPRVRRTGQSPTNGKPARLSGLSGRCPVENEFNRTVFHPVIYSVFEAFFLSVRFVRLK